MSITASTPSTTSSRQSAGAMLTNATLLRIDSPSPGPSIAVRCLVNPPTSTQLTLAAANGWSVVAAVLLLPMPAAGLNVPLATGQTILVHVDGRPTRSFSVLGIVEVVGGVLSYFQVFLAAA